MSVLRQRAGSFWLLLMKAGPGGGWLLIHVRRHPSGQLHQKTGTAGKKRQIPKKICNGGSILIPGIIRDNVKMRVSGSKLLYGGKSLVCQSQTTAMSLRP